MQKRCVGTEICCSVFKAASPAPSGPAHSGPLGQPAVRMPRGRLTIFWARSCPGGPIPPSCRKVSCPSPWAWQLGPHPAPSGWSSARLLHLPRGRLLLPRQGVLEGAGRRAGGGARVPTAHGPGLARLQGHTAQLRGHRRSGGGPRPAGAARPQPRRGRLPGVLLQLPGTPPPGGLGPAAGRRAAAAAKRAVDSGPGSATVTVSAGLQEDPWVTAWGHTGQDSCSPPSSAQSQNPQGEQRAWPGGLALQLPGKAPVQPPRPGGGSPGRCPSAVSTDAAGQRSHSSSRDTGSHIADGGWRAGDNHAGLPPVPGDPATFILAALLPLVLPPSRGGFRPSPSGPASHPARGGPALRPLVSLSRPPTNTTSPCFLRLGLRSRHCQVGAVPPYPPALGRAARWSPSHPHSPAPPPCLCISWGVAPMSVREAVGTGGGCPQADVLDSSCGTCRT